MARAPKRLPGRARLLGSYCQDQPAALTGPGTPWDFPMEMGVFPGKMAAADSPSGSGSFPPGNPPPGPCGTEGPGLSKGETRRPFLPHRCGGETPPWPRRGRRRFRQWQRVLRGSASAGRAGPGRAGPGGAPQGPGREGKGGKVPSTARTGTCPWRESSGGHRVAQRDGGEEEGIGVVQLWEKGLG